MSLQHRLKELRRKMGLSQAKFAELIHVSSGNVGDWEIGRAAPGSGALTSIAKACNVSLDWLILGKTNSPYPPGTEELIQRLTEEEIHKLGEYAEFLLFLRDNEKENQQEQVESGFVYEEEGHSNDQSLLLHDELKTYLAERDRNEDYTFGVKVKGDSMADIGLEDGDIAVILPQASVKHNEPALFRINNELTIKYLTLQDDKIYLSSANPKYQPIFIDPDLDYAIIGKVIQIIK